MPLMLPTGRLPGPRELGHNMDEEFRSLLRAVKRRGENFDSLNLDALLSEPDLLELMRQTAIAILKNPADIKFVITNLEPEQRVITAVDSASNRRYFFQSKYFNSANIIGSEVFEVFEDAPEYGEHSFKTLPLKVLLNIMQTLTSFKAIFNQKKEYILTYLTRFSRENISSEEERSLALLPITTDNRTAFVTEAKDLKTNRQLNRATLDSLGVVGCLRYRLNMHYYLMYVYKETDASLELRRQQGLMVSANAPVYGNISLELI